MIVETKTISINNDNVNSLCTGYNVRLNQYNAAAVCERNTSPGYVTLKSSSVKSLFPKTEAIPHQMDVMIAGRITVGKVHITLNADGAKITEHAFWNAIVEEKISNNLYPAISSRSDLSFVLQQDSRVDVGRLHHASIQLLFKRFTCEAVVANSQPGISVSVSNPNPYQGENVIFKVSVPSDFVWYGWFSNPECTQLVSENVEYSVHPESDLKLYAKVIPSKPSTEILVKVNGKWELHNNVFLKENGVWKAISFDEFQNICDNNSIIIKQ